MQSGVTEFAFNGIELRVNEKTPLYKWDGNKSFEENIEGHKIEYMQFNIYFKHKGGKCNCKDTMLPVYVAAREQARSVIIGRSQEDDVGLTLVAPDSAIECPIRRAYCVATMEGERAATVLSLLQSGVGKPVLDTLGMAHWAKSFKYTCHDEAKDSYAFSLQEIHYAHDYASSGSTSLAGYIGHGTEVAMDSIVFAKSSQAKRIESMAVISSMSMPRYPLTLFRCVMALFEDNIRVCSNFYNTCPEPDILDYTCPTCGEVFEFVQSLSAHTCSTFACSPDDM